MATYQGNDIEELSRVKEQQGTDVRVVCLVIKVVRIFLCQEYIVYLWK